MKKVLVNLIESFLSFFGILIYTRLIYNYGSYNLLITLLFLILFIFFYKYKLSLNKKQERYSIIISLLLSLMLSIGNMVNLYIEEVNYIFNLKNLFLTILCFFGLFILFYKLFGILFYKLKKIEVIEAHNKMKIKTFILMIGVIFIGYFLYFIRFYPAIMTPDSYYVIHYANNFILSDYHTFGHTWFFGIFFHLGKFLFHSLSKSIAFSTLVQMLCMSLIFSTSIRYFYNKGLNKKICIFLTLFFAFNPLHAHYSITLWRDIMFGGSFLLILICLYEFISSKSKIKIAYIILFIIGVLIMLFFRNNGIYVYLFCIPFIIGFMKNKRIMMSIITISIACFYFVIKGPVFDYFNIEKTTSVEAFSIPLQQIARVIALDKNITAKDEKYLKKLFIDYDKVSTEYKPYISDPIKSLANNEILSDNKRDFLDTYLHLFTKYPNIYFEAYFSQTLGYWYPDVIYASTGGESVGFFPEENIRNTPLTPKWYNKVIDISVSRKIPLSNIIWSLGLQFIILLISFVMTMYFGNKKYLLCYIPLFGLWLSLMASTPVFCELRYIYGLFTCSPFLVFLPFIIKKEKVIND